MRRKVIAEVIEIPIGVYDCVLYAYFGEVENFNVFLKTKGWKKLRANEQTLGMAGIRDCNPILWCRDANDYGTIAHEIFHAAHKLLAERDMELTESSEEAWAYLIGFLTGKIYERLERK